MRLLSTYRTDRNTRLLFWLTLIAALVVGVAQLVRPLFRPEAGTLVISEFVASNGASLADEDGDFSDWIEIYNPGSRPVNLSGWALTDALDQPDRWTFPNRTLESRQYLVVFASGKDRRPTEAGAPLHTNFKLSKTGEPLALYNRLDGSFADIIRPGYPEQFRDIAYGRRDAALAAESGFGYLLTPTPGRPNNAGSFRAGIVADVTFSRPHGFYAAPLRLELSTQTNGATIYYTLDGRAPSPESGQVYAGPIPITRTTVVRAVAVQPAYLPSPINTQTYIFLDDVLAQPAQPPGFPPTWGFHGEDSVQYGYVNNAPVMADYEMDPEITGDPRIRPLLKEGLTSIPTLSLVTDVQNFAELYANSKERGRAWERPVSVELIHPDGRDGGFQINAGFRIQGQAGRRDYMPKHSFRLFFRGEYGPTQLAYPLFPDSPVTSFNTLVLRGGVNRSFAGRPGRDHRLATYTRDEWARASQIEMSGAGAHGIFVHLYINGLYWGLYNVVERPDASFLSAYLGGQPQEWFSANHNGPVSGSPARFEAFRELAGRGGFDNPEKYAVIKSYVDIPWFIDYIILNWYAGNVDWAHTNWYLGARYPDGLLRLFEWDAETTWDGNGAWLMIGYDDPLNFIKPFFVGLLQNADFRMELADRLYYHLFNNGPLTDANARARWERINQIIDPAIVAESARWGDARYEPPISRDDWLKAREYVLAQMDGNAARLIALARQAGYYPPVDPPVFNRQGGLVPLNFALSITLPPDQAAQDATIYYTTDGSDPRLPVSGEVSPQARVYHAPLVLTTTTHLKARLLAGGSNSPPVWSALNQAIFRVVQGESKLRITEIMYHPAGGDEYEFIELKNTGTAPLSLANLYFEGIDFAFPPTARPLPPGEMVVLARDRAAFAGRYPGVPVAGVYNGQLANGGEEIRVKDRRGNTVLLVAYDDENGWPVSPDGRGDSLVLANPDGDPNEPRNWRASAHLYGSPGADEPER